jgi:trigger factor
MKTNHQLKQLKDKSFTIELTLESADIQKEYQHVLTEVQANFEKKGFRKGSVPLNIITQEVDPKTIIEEVLNHLLPEAYKSIIEEHKLKPVVEPSIKIKSEKLTLENNWELELSASELPEISIDPNAFVEIKTINKESDPKADKKAQIDKIITVILKNTKLDLPEIIVNNDVNRRLSDLVDQLRSANLTVDQYLKNKKTTLVQYRQDLEKQIKNDWSLNLAINQIAIDQKLEVDKKEVEELLAQSPELKNDPNLVYYLLTQQKVINYLQSIL